MDTLREELAETEADLDRLEPQRVRVETLAPWWHERFPWVDLQRDLAVLVDNRETILRKYEHRSGRTANLEGRARSEQSVRELVKRINASGRYSAREEQTSPTGRNRGEEAQFPFSFRLLLTVTGTSRGALTVPLESPVRGGSS